MGQTSPGTFVDDLWSYNVWKSERCSCPYHWHALYTILTHYHWHTPYTILDPIIGTPHTLLLTLSLPHPIHYYWPYHWHTPYTILTPYHCHTWYTILTPYHSLPHPIHYYYPLSLTHPIHYWRFYGARGAIKPKYVSGNVWVGYRVSHQNWITFLQQSNRHYNTTQYNTTQYNYYGAH